MTIQDRLPEELKRYDAITVQFFNGLMERAGVPEDRGLTPYIAVDLEGFFELVKDLIDDYQDREAISDQSRVSFSEEEPKFDSNAQRAGAISEYISYKLIDRIPGKVSGGRHGASEMGSDGRREWKPRLRYVKEPDGEILNRTLVMGQFYDNVIEFSCWAQTNKAANARAFWFEDLLSSYRWYLKARGVSEVYFIRRLEDISSDGKIGSNYLKQRRLRYMVRTDRTYTIEESVLRRLVVKAGVAT